MNSSALDDFLDLCDADPDFDSGEDDDNDDPFERLMRKDNEDKINKRKADEDNAKGFQDLFGTPAKIENVTNSSSSQKLSSASFTKNSMKEPSIIGGNGKRFIPKPDHSDAICDPYTHLRLFKNSVQLYSDEVQTLELSLKERNLTIPFTPISRIPFKTDKGEFWASAVVVKKPPGVRKSAKGNDYGIWEVSDLDSDDPVTLFLFGNAATGDALKFIPVGALVDLVNPSLMNEKQGEKGKFKLSVSSTSQIRHIGTARDFGYCGSKRKDGKDCMNPVNKFKLGVCIHHASAELRKMNGKGKSKWNKKGFTDFEKAQFAARMQATNPQQEAGNVVTVNFGKSKTFPHESSTKSIAGPSSKLGVGQNKPKPAVRMELQDPTNTLKRSRASNQSSITFSKDTSPLINLLPKESEVHNRVKKELVLDPKRTKHLSERDRILLQNLEAKKSKSDLPSLLTDPNAGSKNFLKYLNNSGRSSEESNNKPGPSSSKSSMNSVPAAASGPIVMTRETMANMQKALNFVKKVGPIEKKDPNAVVKKRKLTTSTATASSSVASPQHALDLVKVNSTPLSGNIDTNSEEFQKILNAKSSHSALAEDNTQEEYFIKLERKEAIENKLLSTFSIATSAVMCRECKYIALGQSEYCKENRHNIRIVKAMKRFFKCKDCGNRTMSLDRLPKRPCTQCSSSSWLAAPVGKEKAGPKLDSEKLAIRGDEEKFLGSTGAKLFL